MRTKHFYAATLVVAIFLSACSSKTVSLNYTNANGQVAQLGNLVFRFSQSLIADSLLNNWDSTEYISFKPHIDGRFRWESPDELVFSPSKPLQPATAYTASIKEDVLRYSKVDKVQSSDAIKFYTAPLLLDDAQVTWVLTAEASRATAPQIQLSFNYAVKAEEVRDKLSITVDGVPQDFAIQNVGTAKAVTVQLQSFKSEDKNAEAKITIAKGLHPIDGNSSTDDKIETQLSIPSPYTLTVNNVEAEHNGTEGEVRIYTSQQLNGQNLQSFISFKPAIKYTVEYTAFGATLRSEAFNADNAYAYTIGKGLRGVIGGTLREDYEGNVAFGNLEADISFMNNKAVYLSKGGSGNIEVRITNTPKVKLIISKIYENNLLMVQRHGYYPKDNSNNEEEYYEEGNSDITAGDIIYSKEIDTRSLPKSGNGRILNITQFEDRLPDSKGIYHVSLRSTQDYWISDSRFISLSDIGLITKQGVDKMYVFANSIKTATPLNGVTVNVYGNNNQLLGTGATNAEGVAEIAVVKKDFAGYKPAMVMAKTADDFNYLPFNNTRVNTSRFDVGGKRLNTTGLDAFVYAERDIYRPGEKVNFAVVVRNGQWKSPGELPVKFKFLLPNGKELKSFRKTLNEQGAAEGSVDLSAAAITGSYLLEVYSSNDVLLSSKNFMIEEFVPDRIKVSAKLDKPFLRPSDAAQLQVQATNFFGPPAANRNWETEIQVKAKSFSAKGFSDFDFTLANGKTFFDKEIKEGKTDESGKASIDYAVPPLYANNGVLQAHFYTTVFDETGRPVSKHTSADIYTQDVFYGIKDDGYYYYALNQPVSFDVAAVNRDGNGVAGSTYVQVIKHEYKTVLVKNGSYFRYNSQREDKIVESKNAAFTGKGKYVFVPRSPGNYEIRVYAQGTNTYVRKTFYSYGGWGSDNGSFEVNTEGQIDIELDKESYANGNTAKILFKTPFSGRMLVTIENDGVLSYQYVDVNKRSASIDVKMDGQFVPNVYVTATLFKPHQLSDIPLTVAHGFKSIKVEEEGRKIAVAITAQKNVRSNTQQTIKVKATPGSYVTLAAVDNGVLQVSNFQTPDPYSYYYQKKALGVTAYDVYPLLFPELKARLSSTGGDGDLEMSKRVNPMPAKRIKILSYWSGLQKANGSGEATFTVDVPQFSGEVRLMAVAYKNENFGAAESAITVADPLVVSTALPRFLSPGDTVQVPVTITNTTNNTANGQATISINGPVKVLGSVSQAISVAPNSESRAYFNIVADPTMALAKINIQVAALGEQFKEETDISIRPPASLQKLTGSGSIAGGSAQHIDMPLNDFIGNSTDYELIVTASPVGEITEQLRYLVQYPYGCTEQTVSSAFPQLYYGDLADKLKGAGRVQNANTNVVEAIRKIKMRQLYNGALTLWDGEGTEDWWTTVYAAHFLLEAKKAGFDVDNSLLETMLGYISNKLKNRQTINYYYNRDQQKKIAPKEVAYGLYVLALAARPQVATMNYYKSSPQLLALDSRYLLSAAYAVAGDKRSYSTFLPQSFNGEASVKQTGGSFYSEVRDEAIALNALLDVDPGNAQIPVMAKHVAERLKKETYLNTQERAFSFLALGKLARNAAKSTVTAEIRSGGKTIGKVDGNDWKGSKALLSGGPLEIVTKGSGRLYYSWQASGISRSGAYKEEDNYLKVRRQFFDRHGNEITGATFKQNDLVIIAITLEKAFSNSIENIVVTDMLPAGFEIENSRTKELPGMDWIKNAATPTAIDVRDDRIHFFVDAYNNRQTYYYAVRAVSLGNYKQGPVSADAMYNGAFHSYHGAGTVRVISK